MIRLALGVSLACLLSSTAAQAQTDQRCSRHYDRPGIDRCQCSAAAGGTVVGQDSKGFNRWQVPNPRMGEFVDCMRKLGYNR